MSAFLNAKAFGTYLGDDGTDGVHSHFMVLVVLLGYGSCFGIGLTFGPIKNQPSMSRAFCATQAVLTIILKAAPLPVLKAVMVPPIASIMLFAKYRPIPVPCTPFVLK